MRTLMVSSGWQQSWASRVQYGSLLGEHIRRRTASAAPPRPPATTCVPKPTGFLSPERDMMKWRGRRQRSSECKVCGEVAPRLIKGRERPDRLGVGGAGQNESVIPRPASRTETAPLAPSQSQTRPGEDRCM
jgi:hypothetical protein